MIDPEVLHEQEGRGSGSRGLAMGGFHSASAIQAQTLWCQGGLPSLGRRMAHGGWGISDDEQHG